MRRSRQRRGFFKGVAFPEFFLVGRVVGMEVGSLLMSLFAERRKQPLLWLVGTQMQQGGCSRCWCGVARRGRTQANMQLKEAVDWGAVRVVCCGNCVRAFPFVMGQSMAALERLPGMEGGADTCVVGTLCAS